MLRRNWIFRDRAHPFDTGIRWWINFHVIQIRWEKNCDHKWIHWMGHCDQQSYRFLKLTPLFLVNLVTWRSSQVLIVFKMCVASWSGWSEPPCSETSFIPNLLWGAFRMSLIIQEMKIAEKTSKSTKLSVQVRPISIEYMRSFAKHCWWNNGFSRSKHRNKRLAI